MKKISVILPCHNECKNLPLLIPEIIKNIPKKYDYEIICVDDGSSDTTALTIDKLALKNKKTKGIIFHKNFGHQNALMAGIRASSGDAVIMMDADFQHPPELINKFISLWEKGHDLVSGRKNKDNNPSPLMKIIRKMGYMFWKRITHGILVPGISDFRLISREIAEYFTELKEKEFFLRGLAKFAAKNPTELFYDVGKRRHGKSSYNTRMFINMFLNGFVSFSDTPIRIAWIVGILTFFGASIFLIVDLISSVLGDKHIIQGYTTTVIILIMFNGLIFLYLGILGEYIGIIFKEVKRRPDYLIERKINLK